MVIILDEMDDIRDGEHPSKNRFLAVPERGRNDSCDRSALEGQCDIGYGTDH